MTAAGGSEYLRAPQRTSRRTLRRRRRQSRRRPLRTAAWAAATLVCSLIAFFLVPTGHVNTRVIVQINGAVLSLPARTMVSQLQPLSALLARPGSVLDITGDVIQLGAGTEPQRQLDGGPVSATSTLAEGDSLLIRQGEHMLEGIRRVAQTIPYQYEVKGKGSIVSLAQAGAPGKRELFKGVASNKEAAVFVLRQAQNAVLQKSNARAPGQKLVALTFDDGPGAYTQAVLDALATRHVPATFFVLGSAAAANKSMIEKMRAAGHEIENHSWNHPDLTTLSEEQVRSQLKRTAEVIGSSRYLRPPYGSSNDALKKLAAGLDLRLVFWTVDTLDWKHQDVNWILNKVKAGAKPGAIILMHDGGGNRKQTAAAIPLVVDWLFSQGYSITTVKQLLG